MFVGHLAVAFLGKRASPAVSLGWFVAAATTLDLLWPLFVLAGWEQVSIVQGATAFTPLVFDHYPWSHSLVMAVVWGVVLAGLSRWRGVDRRAAVLIAALVVSHWVLDFITHAPDLPLWPGTSPRMGLGLWNNIPAALIIEGVLWVVAVALYVRERRARGWLGRIAFWSLVVVSTVMWVTGPWAPPPSSPRELAWFALIGWIVIPWAAWADAYYTTTKGETVSPFPP